MKNLEEKKAIFNRSLQNQAAALSNIALYIAGIDVSDETHALAQQIVMSMGSLQMCMTALSDLAFGLAELASESRDFVFSVEKRGDA